MESLIKFAEKAFEIPSIAIMAMLIFLFALKISKKYFDSKIEERSSKIRFIVEELKSLDKENQYLVEQTFSERYNKLMNYKEIIYFLGTSRPSFNMFLYQSASSYFQFKNTNDSIQLICSSTEEKLRFKRRFLIFGYYFFAVIALSLLQVMPKLYLENMNTFISFYFVIFSFLMFAIMCVGAQIKTENAAKLKLSIEHA